MKDDSLYGFLVPPSDLTRITVGLVIQAFLNGGLFILGTTCILLISRPPQKDFGGPEFQRSTFWKWFILVLLTMNLFYLVAFCVLFTEELYGRPESAALGIILQVCLVSVVYLTDGVMTWRCYMVSNALGPHHWRFHKLLWIFPFCTYITIVLAGIIGALIAILTEDHGYPHVLGAMALVSNAILNIYATTFISIRLLRYERSIPKAAFRPSSPTVPVAKESRHIIQLFIQSAAINVPVAIAAAVTVVNSDWALGSALLSIGIPFQSFSTLLVLHQVALRKSIGQTQANRNRASGDFFTRPESSRESGAV
ncbi:hypothetical protein D9756_006521 [Leucocoprinus leucothites]|uniref:Uncharacterized protein n=1 Tax=Leucocoprinus leucothites TaxID=201217 RepID=A0A8H5G2G2_9AGAR|nr:hypothetical protein D9756_006521 [Leucoagaricus leucothites]